jgi:hypothetical protein
MATGYTLGKWTNGLAEWSEGDTAFLSVAFTWRIQDAVNRAHWLRAEGKRVIAGGPALFLKSMRDMITHVAEVHTKIVDRDGHTREVLQDLQEVMPGMDEGALIHHNPMATVASRGCPVGCHFCIVPPLEGLSFTYLPDFPVRPVLTDNNLSAIDPLYQQHIVDRYITAGVPLLDANSGFEPKTFDEEVFRRWQPINRGVWRMAYDETREGPDVEKAIRMLRRNGVPPRRIQVYVLIGNEPEEACMARIRQVVDWGGEPYAQPIMKLNSLTRSAWVRYDWGSEQRLRQVQRWTNARLWRGAGGEFRPFEEYNPSARRTPDQFYDEQLGLYGEAA